MADGMMAIHPGDFLAEILEDLHMSQAEFARQIGVPRMRISYIINGQRPVTAEMACLFAKAFNQSPSYWLGLQSDYDLKTAYPRLKIKLDGIKPIHIESNFLSPQDKSQSGGRRRAVA
jgi:addiction module HigA family antidote